MQGPYYAAGDLSVFHTEKWGAEARNDSQRCMIVFFNEHLGPTR